MREHCSKCGRLLPIGQLRRVEGKFECLKNAPCEKAQAKLLGRQPAHVAGAADLSVDGPARSAA